MELPGCRADNRAGLQGAVEAACECRGVLVVYSLSRLARSTRDTITLAERLHNAGADLVSLTERIDTTSASGKMLFRLMAVLAEFERDLVAERTASALGYKKSQLHVYGSVPYGYDRSGDDLVGNEAEQQVVKLVLAWRADGQSLRAIAARLNGLGVPTKQGRRWHASTVRYMLSNDLYRDQSLGSCDSCGSANAPNLS